MIKVALCDDDKGGRKPYINLLKTIIKKHKMDVELEVYDSGDALLFEWKDEKNQADILFLDIHMPKTDGMDVARELRQMKTNTEIIFLTVDGGQILQAYDVEAFHYIVKGDTTRSKIEEIFLRCVQKATKRQRQYIQLSCAGEVRNISLDEIYFFEAVNHIIVVHYGDRTFEFYTSLGKLENRLLDKGFVRIHKSYLINRSQVDRVLTKSLYLKDGSELPIGRTKMQEVRRAMGMDHKVD